MSSRGNPKDPTKYLGSNVYLIVTVSRNREPTSADYRQPETGALYSPGTVWHISKNPTTGTEGELWILSKIVANVATWMKMGDGLRSLYGINVPLGISPVIVDLNNRITFTSSDSSIAITGSTNTIDFVADNTYYSLTPYIVGQTGDEHAQYIGPTGIQDAINAAISNGATNTNRVNVYVKPGTYNAFVIHAGINIISLNRNLQQGQPGTVVILGKITADFTGSMEISGCELRTNGDYFLEVTGSSACVPTLKECYLNCLDHNGIHYTTANSSSNIFVDECETDLNNSSVTLHTKTSSGVIRYSDTDMFNTAGSMVPSTDSGGGVEFYSCTHNISFQFTGTAGIISEFSGGGTPNSIIYDLQGSGGVIENFFGNSGTAPCINIGSSAIVDMNYSRITSSNTNAISGSGTLSYAFLAFGTSQAIQNTITLIPTVTKNPFGPILRVITASGTYIPTPGMKFAYVQATGGGAGGGGTPATTSGQVAVGSGGAGGGTGTDLYTAAQIGVSQAITIGTGSPGGIGVSAIDANDTLFGALLVGEGGTGGQASGASTVAATNDSDGGDGSGAIPISGGSGQGGTGAFVGATGFAKGGTGGSSVFGSGSDAGGNTGPTGGGNAKDAQIYGAGGAGAHSIGSGGPFTGGAGSDGIVIITEYL